jgi:hypothetical protein
MIYIREAHPKDGWWLGGGIFGKLVQLFAPKSATNLDDPKTYDERKNAAKQCERALKYGIRTYVDTMDDKVSKAYAAKPTRLYLIGKEGRVVYAGGPGPYGFKPSAFEAAIQQYLTKENKVSITPKSAQREETRLSQVK